MSRSNSKKDNLNYLELLDLSITHPKSYSLIISGYSNPKEALGFFTTNFCLGFFIKILANVLTLRNLNFFFLGINSLLLGIPFTIILLFLLGFTFFIISKILRGKASLKKTLIICAYCSTPLVTLLWVPVLSVIALFFSSFLLVLSFQKINEYSIINSIVTTAIPLMAAILLLELLGLIQPILDLAVTLPLS